MFRPLRLREAGKALLAPFQNATGAPPRQFVQFFISLGAFASFHFQSPERLEQATRGALGLIQYRLISSMAICRHSGGGIPVDRLPYIGRLRTIRLATCRF